MHRRDLRELYVVISYFSRDYFRFVPLGESSISSPQKASNDFDQ